MSSPSATIGGLHHVTAITGDARANLEFYTRVLELRLVKLTVNFDDPGSYHLYYGDPAGSPGTVLTFFAWGGVPRGRLGTPQVSAVAFAVRPGALQEWERRLRRHGLSPSAGTRFGEPLLSFSDPDGLSLEIIETDDSTPSRESQPQDFALTGFRGVTLLLDDLDQSGQFLTEVLRFELQGREAGRARFRGRLRQGDGGQADPFSAVVDLVSPGSVRPGVVAAGSVHHVAFRTPDDEQQQAWRETIGKAGYSVTPVRDRLYFHSIYFREPGGVLFEIATETPGFTIDEPLEELGSRLMLPPWLESSRPELERVLAPLPLHKELRPGAQNE